MENLMDLSSISSAANTRMGTFEINAKEFGSVVATAIGAAQAVGQAVSDSYSFSAQGLQSLADEGEQLVGAIADGAAAVVSAVADAPAEIGAAIAQAGSDVADWVGSAVDTVEDAAANVAAYVGLGAAALSSGVDVMA